VAAPIRWEAGVIVKIQRPIMGDPKRPMALVYNRGRAFEAQMPFTPEIAELFADGSLKVYHHAKSKRGKLLIGERVEEQDF
jgi:hypothetical protein